MPNGNNPQPTVRIYTGDQRVNCPLGFVSGRGVMSFTVHEDFFLPDQRVEIEVQNTTSQTTRFTSTFVSKVRKTISESYYNYADDTPNNIFCSQNNNYCCDKDVTCFRVRHKTAFAGKRLVNTWKVVDARKEEEKQQGGTLKDV
jgi:hypothetical protein